MRRVAALAVLLVLAPVLAAPVAAASVTHVCELVPHGYLAAVDPEGCSVSDVATTRIEAVVYVTQGNVDAIVIEIANAAGERHVFPCAYAVASVACLFPVRTTGIDGVWTVTARIVAADPLGPAVYGNVDTYARLEATFV